MTQIKSDLITLIRVIRANPRLEILRLKSPGRYRLPVLTGVANFDHETEVL